MLSSSISFYDKIKIQKGFDFPRPKLENKSRCPGSWIFLGTLSPWESQPRGDCDRKEGRSQSGGRAHSPPSSTSPRPEEAAHTGLASALFPPQNVLTGAQDTLGIDSYTLLVVAPVASMIVMCWLHNLSKLCISTALDDGEDNR